MNTPDTTHLEPWLKHLRNPNHRDWFRRAFTKILLFEYKPHNLGANDIQQGNILTWKIGDTYITVTHSLSFDFNGLRPGLYFEDDTNDYQLQISVNAPLEVVHAAIVHLNPDRE